MKAFLVDRYGKDTQLRLGQARFLVPDALLHLGVETLDADLELHRASRLKSPLIEFGIVNVAELVYDSPGCRYRGLPCASVCAWRTFEAETSTPASGATRMRMKNTPRRSAGSGSVVWRSTRKNT